MTTRCHLLSWVGSWKERACEGRASEVQAQSEIPLMAMWPRLWLVTGDGRLGGVM